MRGSCRREVESMHLALDVMGGDNAPAEICRGAVLACREFQDLEIALVGQGPVVERTLEETGSMGVRGIHIVHAEEAIGMDEPPSVAIRRKRKSSMRIAMEMVRTKEAEGCVSAGNTGAIVAGGVLVVGRIPGIERPGLGAPLPVLNRVSLLLDVGATVRCKPIHLYQFAIMGEVYMRCIMGVRNPEIALLSNGEEEIKGDEVVIEARELLRKNSSHNFVGYVEGKDVPRGVADVVVCDGFTGNVLLKFGEGIVHGVYDLLREEISKRFLPKVGMVFMIPMFKEIWHRFDDEQYGGTPLLGVDGAVVKAHGRSKAKAISSALRVARDFARRRGVSMIREELMQRGDAS